MAGKAKFERYHGPEQFTSFETAGLRGNGRTFLYITRDDTPELFALAEGFPELFQAALSSLGWHLKNVMQSAMRSGNAPGVSWAERSRMHQARRLEWLKGGRKNAKLKKYVGNVRQKSGQNLFARWKGGAGTWRGQTAMGGRLVNAIRYKRTGPLRVEMGAVTPRTAMYLAAVQGAQRGVPGAFRYRGRQPITPAMRRMFWAAGIPLRKGKTVLEQPKRPLVYPVFRAEEAHFLPYIERKIAEYLATGFIGKRRIPDSWRSRRRAWAAQTA